jgi:hypothetical protein
MRAPRQRDHRGKEERRHDARSSSANIIDCSVLTHILQVLGWNGSFLRVDNDQLGEPGVGRGRRHGVDAIERTLAAARVTLPCAARMEH